MTLDAYARHSSYSDPGPYAGLINDLPTEIGALTSVVRNVLVHYRAAGITFTGDRLAEINNRWLTRILQTDQKRFSEPLARQRPIGERVVGCCRDFALLTVSALRQQGIAARSRVGFASYFIPGFHCDHVVAEYWNGQRWVWVDAQLEPGPPWPFDVQDIPHPGPLFVTAAQSWQALRRGEIDPMNFGVDPNLPARGEWFIYDGVLQELAHRRRDELLLWDSFGAMVGPPPGVVDVELADEIAALLVAADAGDETAEWELARRYDADDRLNPRGRVVCHSPDGSIEPVDLAAHR